MNISGNAGDWWDNAAGSYRRGHQPEAGAVLVFRPFGPMRAGHVAVVSKLVNAREILVDQANWPHGDVVEGVAVYDVSPDNDWTTVRVSVETGGSWGRTNPTFGFIYPDGGPARDTPVVAQDEPQFPPPPSWATPWPKQSQARVEPTVAQAQPQAAPAQPIRPEPRAAQPQPRFQLATAEIEEADDEDEPAPARRHATPAPHAPEKAKADARETRKDLMAKAKPGRHERIEAKAEHSRAEQQKLAKAEHEKARQEKLAAAKSRHEQARQDKLAKAEHGKAEHTKLAAAKAERDKLAKAEHDKARQEKLAKAAQAKQERLAKAEQRKAEHLRVAKAAHDPARRVEPKPASAREHQPTKRTHLARNEQPAGEGTNIEQIAEVGRSRE